jgi:hypothetical protein
MSRFDLATSFLVEAERGGHQECVVGVSALQPCAPRIVDGGSIEPKPTRREIRSGGKLVVLTMAPDDAADFGYRTIVAAIAARRTIWSRRGVALERRRQRDAARRDAS